jgi:hypothetical protein
MKGNVNPFQPWRPAEVEVPPPIHASRPWRPPVPRPTRLCEETSPLAELVDKKLPPSDRAPKRGEDCNGRGASGPKVQRPIAGPPARKAPAPELRADQKAIVGMVFVLGIMVLIGMGWLGGTHLPRVAVALLAVGAGFTVGISVARRQGWSVRLGWMAAGLALAGLSGWFVPTTGGVNLWSAYRQMDELRALPAGDVAGYLRGAAERKQIVAEFPAFAEDVTEAESAWVRRTADAAIEKADRLLETDAHAALGDLVSVNAALSPLEHYPKVRTDMESALRRARQACR